MDPIKVVTSRSPATVEIDTNATTPSGAIRARVSDVQGFLIQGDTSIVVRDNDQGLEGFAEIVSLDEEKGLIYLNVAWETFIDVVESAPVFELQRDSWRQTIWANIKPQPIQWFSAAAPASC